MKKLLIALIFSLLIIISPIGCSQINGSGSQRTLTITEGTDQNGGSGSVNPDYGKHLYKSHEEISVTATPGPGSVFVGWQGIDGVLSEKSAVDPSKPSSGKDYKIDIVMTRDVTLTALFVNEASYLESQKQPTTLSLASTGGTYGGKAILTAKLTTTNSFPLNTLENPSLTFSFNLSAGNSPSAGTLGEVETDLSGEASYNLSLVNIDAGTYDWSVSFAGNDNYQSCTGSSTLTVAKAETGISAVSCKVTYDGVTADPMKPGATATLTYWHETEPNGGGGWTPLSGMQVDFYYGDRDVGYGITDSNGLATIPSIMGQLWQSGTGVAYDAGEYPNFIRAVFTGDQNFDSSESEGNLTVNKTSSFLENANINGGLGLTNGYAIQIFLGTGNNSNSGAYNRSGNTLTLSINGNIYTGVTDSQGIARIYITSSLTKGTYPYTITFDGDENTTGSSLSGNQTVY